MLFLSQLAELILNVQPSTDFFTYQSKVLWVFFIGSFNVDAVCLSWNYPRVIAQPLVLWKLTKTKKTCLRLYLYFHTIFNAIFREWKKSARRKHFPLKTLKQPYGTPARLHFQYFNSTLCNCKNLLI